MCSRSLRPFCIPFFIRPWHSAAADFLTPIPKISYSEDLSSTGFPASTFCLRLGADVGSLVFGPRSADDKGDVKAKRPRAFATDKIFLLH